MGSKYAIQYTVSVLVLDFFYIEEVKIKSAVLM